MSYPRVCVIVHAYARPTMLRECLLSVAAARPDRVVVVDDGSEGYSVPKLVGLALYQRVEYGLICAEPMGIEDRMRTPRQGRLINDALAIAEADVICYICDDDLMHRGWIDALRAEWAANPQREMVRGHWLQFDHGATPREADPACALDGRGMTDGNFAHHISLTKDRGVQWPVNQTSCLDNGFLWSCHHHGVNQFAVPLLDQIAGWRREHPKAGVHHSTGESHRESLRALLQEGYLE